MPLTPELVLLVMAYLLCLEGALWIAADAPDDGTAPHPATVLLAALLVPVAAVLFVGWTIIVLIRRRFG